MSININLHLLNASGSLDSISDLIKSEFTKSIGKISQKLPVSDVDVVVYNNPRGTIPEYGIGGFSPSAHLMFVYLDANRSGLDEVIRSDLVKTLSHELHHCMRWRNPGYGRTLLEELVTEGLACHFELEVCGGEPKLYCRALIGTELIEYMNKAKAEFNSTDFGHRNWFFGSKEKRIPRWAGYSLGFKLVGDYLKVHPGLKPSALYSVKAEKFGRGS